MAKDLSLAPLIELYSKVLTDKQREVIELYYFEDLSLAEIAEHSGISRQGVRDSIKRGETVILELESQLGFAKRAALVDKALEDIKSEAREIILFNGKYTASAAIERSAEAIVEIVDGIQ